MATLQAQKKLLRKSMSAVLRTLTASEIQTQSEQVVRRLLDAPFFQSSDSVSCYLSMPTAELDTSSLVAEIIRSGKTLFVPRIDKSVEGKMDFLKVHGEADIASFPAGLWGIREPDNVWQGTQRQNALDPSTGLDLILLPGVAFDSALSRLGHGKGYYDRFIARYAAAHDGRRPLLVGLALREQILDAGQIPVGAHDWPVDAIVGPDGILGATGEPPHVPMGTRPGHTPA
ncbi:5-formyltetrahydrofolate cyclo-ligase [Phanerochaete sordida]|uniref:5-formyltetrahydrofolate cyclo-ligase n=1 Tax=Phanerochaete sordida TaxID=48140 RepID=A0A9P3GH37_9APHY|nr:5-formyltetrahydrofolate cyclo-ligase [Phanerochaete sordida]